MYVPYTGSAGPTEKQIENNNKALHRALRRRGIEAHLVELIVVGVGIGGTKIKVVRVGKVHIVYDRWGFTTLEVDDLDQASWNDTIDWVDTH